MVDIKQNIRKVEQDINSLFSIRKYFSENLIKYEDDILKEKYDNNYFEYIDSFSVQELKDAIDYQLKRGDNFIKFMGRVPLIDNYGLEQGLDITMLLKNNDVSKWKDNNNIIFKVPNINDIKELELRHYGKVYGEKFTVDNVDRISSKMEYLGAYLDDKLIGICVPYNDDKYCCIDEILVDKNYRNKYICTSLIKYIVMNNSDKCIFLHADNDDTPKNLYNKLGFDKVDEMYIYQNTDLHNYKI